MSYEDTHCPCGGKKIPDTMLCDACLEAFKDHPSMAVFQDRRAPTNARHHAAIVLCSLSRARKRSKAPRAHATDCAIALNPRHACSCRRPTLNPKVEHRPTGQGGSDESSK